MTEQKKVREETLEHTRVPLGTRDGDSTRVYIVPQSWKNMSTAGILGVSLGGLLSTGPGVCRGATRGGSGAQSWKIRMINHNSHRVTLSFYTKAEVICRTQCFTVLKTCINAEMDEYKNKIVFCNCFVPFICRYFV